MTKGEILLPAREISCSPAPEHDVPSGLSEARLSQGPESKGGWCTGRQTWCHIWKVAPGNGQRLALHLGSTAY